MNNINELINNIERIHTTELGYLRIKKNLELSTNDIVEWCKKIITNKQCNILRKGKNWYACIDNITITINAHSFTIITAHKNIL